MAEPRMPEHKPLVHVAAGELTAGTSQTPGMHRQEALSGATAGAEHIWMGESRVAPGVRSSDHHHGESESGIYVVSGNPEFVFLEHGVERRIRTRPGDYVYVPPFVPHREENPTDDDAVVVLARNTQEAIVVNLTSLDGQEVP